MGTATSAAFSGLMGRRRRCGRAASLAAAGRDLAPEYRKHSGGLQAEVVIPDALGELANEVESREPGRRSVSST
jgi:hypothetical protein